MEIQDYLKILKGRWVVIAVTTLVAVVGALGVSLLTTPLYQSTAKMFVSATGGSTVGEAYQNNLFSQQRVASYSELVTGEALAARVLDVLPLDLTPSDLAEKVEAQSTPDTVLFDITATDASPTLARDIANAMAAELVTQVRSLETPSDGGTPAAGVKIVQLAGVSETPVSPKTLRNLAIGAGLGLLLGIAVAVLRDRLDNTVKDRRDVEAVFGKTQVGSIPFDKRRGEHPAIEFHDAGQSSSAEAFRELRTNLQFLAVDNPPRVVVVTSAIPSEGKSTTAVNLALAMAEAGHHVALVEGDLRRPRISKYLGVLGSVGLSTVLAGQAELNDVMQPTRYEGLEVMASGKLPPNPSELLGSEASRTLIDQLRSNFDYVIVDGAPLLPVTDSAVLTTHTDGALIVVRHGHTKTHELDRAIKNLEAIGARVLGVVMVMTPIRKGDAYSYSYNYTADSDGTRVGVPPTPAPSARTATTRASGKKWPESKLKPLRPLFDRSVDPNSGSAQ